VRSTLGTNETMYLSACRRTANEEQLVDTSLVLGNSVRELETMIVVRSVLSHNLGHIETENMLVCVVRLVPETLVLFDGNL